MHRAVENSLDDGQNIKCNMLVVINSILEKWVLEMLRPVKNSLEVVQKIKCNMTRDSFYIKRGISEMHRPMENSVD